MLVSPPVTPHQNTALNRSWHPSGVAQRSLVTLSILGLLVPGRRKRFAIKTPRQQCPMAGWPFHGSMAGDSPHSGQARQQGEHRQSWGLCVIPSLVSSAHLSCCTWTEQGWGQPRGSPRPCPPAPLELLLDPFPSRAALSECLCSLCFLLNHSHLPRVVSLGSPRDCPRFLPLSSVLAQITARFSLQQRVQTHFTWCKDHSLSSARHERKE